MTISMKLHVYGNSSADTHAAVCPLFWGDNPGTHHHSPNITNQLSNPITHLYNSIIINQHTMHCVSFSSSVHMQYLDCNTTQHF